MLAALITGAAALRAPFIAAPTRSACTRSACCRMELPFTLVDGWRQRAGGDDAAKRAEAEAAFGVSVLADEAVWETNDFTPYSGDALWTQVEVDRVTLITTYVALNFLTKLACTLDNFSCTEYTLSPLGQQNHNVWTVYGYVSPRERIVRAEDGSASFGKWYLQTLEPDATPTRLKYYMMQETKLGAAVGFERL